LKTRDKLHQSIVGSHNPDERPNLTPSSLDPNLCRLLVIGNRIGQAASSLGVTL
jgi:hypothetical protein